MKTIVSFLLGLLCGAAHVWWLIPVESRLYRYRSTNALRLLGNEGKTVAVLPAGTPLLAGVKLTRTPDLGWWGFAPILFDDMWRAQDLGVEPWEGGEEVWTAITLSATEVVEHGAQLQSQPRTTLPMPGPTVDEDSRFR